MRSNLVFGAMTNVPNRYLLTRLASTAARKLHRPGVRIGDTIDDVLVRFSRANPIGCAQAMREPLPVRLRPEMTRVIPHKSEFLPLPPARENSNPFVERLHSSGNSLTATLGFQTYSDARVS
jgi:hypothetical protein